MQKNLVLSGDFEVMSTYEFKSGKKLVKLLDKSSGKIIKIISSAVSLNGGSDSYRVVNLKFYKDGFDILEIAGEIFEEYQEV